MTKRRISPPRNAVNLAAMISICQLIAKRVRGLSALKQSCAKLTRSRRNNARYSSGVSLSDGSFTTETRRRCLLEDLCSYEYSVSSVSPWWIFASSARRNRARRFSTTSSSAGVSGKRLRRRAGAFFDVLQHVDQHLGRAQIGAGRFVDQLRDHRLAFGHPSAHAVRGHDHRLVQSADEQRRQVLGRGRGPRGLPD